MPISLVVSDTGWDATWPISVLYCCAFWGFLSCTQASGTNRYLLINPGYIQFGFLDVGQESSLSSSLGVADIVTRMSHFATYCALSHYVSSLCMKPTLSIIFK